MTEKQTTNDFDYTENTNAAVFAAWAHLRHFEDAVDAEASASSNREVVERRVSADRAVPDVLRMERPPRPHFR